MMKLGYANAFDALVDIQAGQDRQAETARADAFRATPEFLAIAETDANSDHWASIGRLAKNRDFALRQARDRHARIDEMVRRDREEEDRKRAEHRQSEIADLFYRFESGQDARLNLLAWREVRT